MIAQSIAQLELKVATDKNKYEYGENIVITCTIKNISDSTISITAPCTDSFQAEFEFNNYYARDWSVCFTLEQELIFFPGGIRKYSWTIDPNKFGLPDKVGIQRIVGHYFYNSLTDTTYIDAPLFLGGQLAVGFPTATDTLLQPLRDSLNIDVLNRIDYSTTLGRINEIWQMYGFKLDSIYNVLNNDSRFTWVNYNRSILYDSISVTSIEKEKTIIREYYLCDAYPNPFNSTTRFELEISHDEKVNIVLFNILGEKISTIYNGNLIKNTRYFFRIEDNNLATGIYYFQVSSPSFIQSKKIILLK